MSYQINIIDNQIMHVQCLEDFSQQDIVTGYSKTDFMDALADYIPIWNMNTIAENFLEILLKYRPQYKKSLTYVKQDRQKFFSHQSFYYLQSHLNLMACLIQTY